MSLTSSAPLKPSTLSMPTSCALSSPSTLHADVWLAPSADATLPALGERRAFWDAGAEVFINKGVNGRWKDTLPAEGSQAYTSRAAAELGAACAHWLAYGDAV